MTPISLAVTTITAAAITTAVVRLYLKPRRLPRLIRSRRRCPVPHLILERADAWAASLGCDGYTILRDGGGTRWRVESYRGTIQVSDAYARRMASCVREHHPYLRATRWSWYDHPSGARGYITHPCEA